MSNCNWQHHNLSDEDMKNLVKDVYDTKTFTSLHFSKHDSHLIGSVFMSLIFLGAAPSEPSFPEKTGDIKTDRKNKINHIDNVEQWKKDYKQWEDEEDMREQYMSNIGMLYEDNSKAMPTSINGYPIFSSCKILSKLDTTKFLEKYKKYEKARETFEKEW